MTVRELLEVDGLRLRMVVGEEALDRTIGTVYTTDLRDPRRYLRGDELVLTSGLWYRGPEDAEQFVQALVDGRACGLVAYFLAIGGLPDDVVEACRRHGLPLLTTAQDSLSWSAISEVVIDRRTEEVTRNLADALRRNRDALAALAAGEGAAAMLQPLANELGGGCWLLSLTGRVVHGTEPLDEEHLDAVWTAALAAGGAPSIVRLPGRGPVSIFLLDQPGSGYLVCSGDSRRWQRERREAVETAGVFLALETARLDERRATEQRFACELLDLATAPEARPAELAARMRTFGIDAGGALLVISAAPGRGGPHWRLAQAVVDDAIAPMRGEAAIATTEEDTVAIAAVDGAAAGADVAAHARAIGTRCAAALDGRQISIGISWAAEGAATLPRALEEARQARGLAALQEDAVAVMEASAMNSHVLLLAGLPADIRRSFRTHVLEPLVKYDEVHQSELVRTLETFLNLSCAWQECAKELHIHVNTLRYRIGRIEELTNRDLSSMADRVDFFLALRAN